MCVCVYICMRVCMYIYTYIGVLHHFKINPSARCMTADNLTCTNTDIFSKDCFSFAHIFHVLRTRIPFGLSILF